LVGVEMARALVVCALLLPCTTALSVGGGVATRRAQGIIGRCEVRLETVPPPGGNTAGPAEGTAASQAEPQLPAWFDDLDESAPAPLAQPPPPPPDYLELSDLENTKWKVKATPREDSWLSGGVRDQEFTLLGDNTVVWGGSAGGYGTGGRWALKDGLLEVIRSTPLGLVTGRDYYMMNAISKVDEELQFELEGVIRSYNAIQPVMVIADFVATRQPGRFVRDVDEDDE